MRADRPMNPPGGGSPRGTGGRPGSRPPQLLPAWPRVLAVVAHPDDEITLLDYPDGRLAAVPPCELAAHVTELATRHRPDGLLVFDDTGITGHPDHQAATAAAVLAGRAVGLPVLAWTLPAAVAARLQAETGQAFTGRPADQTDFCVRVDRTRQRRAALLHASQISPAAALWRRLQLQGDREHLRWLVPPRG